jgi:hypothetical protein
VALVGVFDSRLCNIPTRFHLYLVTFLCRPIDGAKESAPSHSDEVLDVRWFAEGALPDDIGPGAVSRIPEAYRIWRRQGQAFFDK